MDYEKPENYASRLKIYWLVGDFILVKWSIFYLQIRKGINL